MVAILGPLKPAMGETKNGKKSKVFFKHVSNLFKIKPIGKTSKTCPGKKPVK